MVALFLEFSTCQVGKIVDIVNVVKTVAVEMVAKFTGIKPLQQGAVVLGQTCQTAGDAPFFGINHNGVQNFLFIATA